MKSLKTEEFGKIEEYILEYSGILLSRVPKLGVSERILKHMASLKVDSVDSYLDLLKNPGNLAIRDGLISLVTVNESYLFRNPSQFNFLANELLPKLGEKKRDLKKRIYCWSAGCSTGEELYSMAFIVNWFQEKNPGLSFSLLGSDINTRSLEKARLGKYRRRSVRASTRMILERFNFPYLRETPDGYEIEDEIREKVNFSFLNLRNLCVLKTFPKMDIIFCRNVLIYFEESFKVQLLTAFVELLLPGGHIFLGETESLPEKFKKLELVKCKGCYCYRKVEEQEPQKDAAEGKRSSKSAKIQENDRQVPEAGGSPRGRVEA